MLPPQGLHWLPFALHTSSHPTSTQRLPPLLEVMFRCFSRGLLCPSMEIATLISTPLTLIYAPFSP